MDIETEATLLKLLAIDMNDVANKLKLMGSSDVTLEQDDLNQAVCVLNRLSVCTDEVSKNCFIAISALLWEHSRSEYSGLRDILIVLLSRIGYAPSSIILDPTFKDDHKFEPLSSILFQWGATANQLKYEVEVNERSFLLTDYQRQIWESMETKKLVGVSAPTSAGKSFVLLLKCAKAVIEGQNDIVYIVPTLSLVNQVTEDFIDIFCQLDYFDYEVFNSYNAELKTDAMPQIFVLTQERAISAFSMREAPFDKPFVLIVDEIQNIERVSAGSSEMRSKILLDAILEFRFSPSVEKIVLSGPRISGIDTLGMNLFGEEDRLSISTEISPVLNITYSIEKIGNSFYFKQYCSLLETPRKELIANSSQIVGHGGKRYDDAFLEYLTSLIQNLGRDSQNIIFAPTKNQARKTAVAIAQAFEEDKSCSTLSSYLKETVHSNYILAEIINHGVAYHHGALPDHARKVIEKAIGERILKNVSSTTTLMQGVNLPTQNIVIRNPHLYISKKENSVELSSYEMANLRGRAGRLLKDFIGRTYVLDENEFLKNSEEYKQESLFENTYKELDSSYEGAYKVHEKEIVAALANESPSYSLEKSYRHIVIHVRQTLLKYGRDGARRLSAIGIDLPKEDFENTLKSLRGIGVSREICAKNRYWDPLVLDALHKDQDLPPVPTRVGDRNNAKMLEQLLGYLRNNDRYSSFFIDRIPSRYHNDRMLSILCSLTVSWAGEKPLKKILDTNYYNTNPEYIDDAISLLQNTVAFDLPVLLRPIYDLRAQESVFLTFIESGAYRPVTRKLIEIGIPRETSIYLTENYLNRLDGTSESLYEDIKGAIRKEIAQIPYWIRIQLSTLQ